MSDGFANIELSSKAAMACLQGSVVIYTFSAGLGSILYRDHTEVLSMRHLCIVSK